MIDDEELAAAFVAFVHAQPDHPAVVKLLAAFELFEAVRQEAASG